MSQPKTQVVKKSANIFSIMAAKYQLAPEKFLETITKTIMRPGKDGRVATMEEIAAFLIVANKYGLDPFTNEIYAFPAKKGGIIPVIGVDGFVRKINNAPDFNGMEITFSEEIVTMEGAKPCPEWCEVKLYRKGIERPVIVREYLDEVYREPFKGKDGYVSIGPWQTHTKRMLRHKTIIQTGRAAGMLIGVYDEDEAQRIIDAEIIAPLQLSGKPAVAMPEEIKPTAKVEREKVNTVTEDVFLEEEQPIGKELNVLEALEQPVGAKFDVWGILFDHKSIVTKTKKDVTYYKLSPREGQEIIEIAKFGKAHEGIANDDTVLFRDVEVKDYKGEKNYLAQEVEILEKGKAQ